MQKHSTGGHVCITERAPTRWICDGRPGPTRHYAGALQGLRRRPTMSLVRPIQMLSVHPILARALHVIYDHVIFRSKSAPEGTHPLPANELHFKDRSSFLIVYLIGFTYSFLVRVSSPTVSDLQSTCPWLHFRSICPWLYLRSLCPWLYFRSLCPSLASPPIYLYRSQTRTHPLPISA